MIFTNPRLVAVVGRFSYKVRHDPKKGCRISRYGFGRPKLTKSCEAAALVNGDDGNFYVLELAGSPRFITVKDGRFKDAHVFEYGQSTAFARYKTAEYDTLLRLIQTASLGSGKKALVK